MRYTRCLILCLLMIFCAPVIAQNAERYPPLIPITADNASRLQLIGYLTRGGVEDVIWSPDSTQLGIVNKMGVWLYDLATPTAVPRLMMNPWGEVTNATFSPDGRWIAYTVENIIQRQPSAYLRVFNVQTAEAVFTYPMDAKTPQIAFSPDSAYLAIKTTATVELWQTGSWANEYRYLITISYNPINTTTVTSLNFSPDSRQLALIDDGLVYVMSVSTKAVEPLANMPDMAHAEQLIFSHNGRFLAIQTDLFVVLYDLVNDTHQLLSYMLGIGGSLHFSPDDALLALVAQGNANFPRDTTQIVTLWDINARTVRTKFPTSGNVAFVGDMLAFKVGDAMMHWHPDGDILPARIAVPVGHFLYSPDGLRVATVGGLPFFIPNQPETINVVIWNTLNGEDIHHILLPVMHVGSRLDFADSGDFFVVEGGQYLQKWENSTFWFRPFSENTYEPGYEYAEQVTLHAATNYISSVTAGGLEEWIIAAICSMSITEMFQGWDLWDSALIYKAFVGRRLTFRLLEQSSSSYEERCIYSMAAQPNGTLLATAHRNGMLRLWNLSEIATRGGRDFNQGAEWLSWIAHPDQIFEVIYTSDGKSLITVGTDHEIKTWDTATGQLEKSFRIELEFPIRSAIPAVNPAGTRLAIGLPYPIEEIQMIDLATGGQLFTIREENSTALTFSPDGSVLLVDGDGRFTLFDANTGERISDEYRLSGVSSPIIDQQVVFHPSGLYLLSASADGLIRVWGIPAEE